MYLFILKYSLTREIYDNASTPSLVAFDTVEQLFLTLHSLDSLSMLNEAARFMTFKNIEF